MKRAQALIFTLLLTCTLFFPIRVVTAKLTETLEGHTDLVWSVAFSPDGKTLASASWDQTVRLWNVNTGQLLHTLSEHTNETLSVAFSLDGQTLASADWDGNILLWNPRNGRLRRTLTGHARGVPSIAFSPDGTLLASGSADRTIRLWNTTTWKLQRTLTGHTDVIDAVVFSPDGTLLASGSRDATIRLWHPDNARPIKTLTEHTASVGRLAFSPDGQVLASGSDDQTVRLWDPVTGELTETLTGFEASVNPVAFSPDGSILLIGGESLAVWDTQTGSYKAPLAVDIGGTISVAFSPDGQLAASGGIDTKIRLWGIVGLDAPFASLAFDITNIPGPVPPPEAVRDFFDLEPFYQQWIGIRGFPVIASAQVNPYAIKEAAWLVWQMIGHRPDVLKVLANHQQRLSILSVDEAFLDLPEFERVKGGTRFLAAYTRDIVCGPCLVVLASEEMLLRPDSSFPHFLIHEFAHVIHSGLKWIDPTFDDRLKAAYDAAMQNGLWRDYYAASNRDEYWAEATTSWFNATQSNAVNTRGALKTYDPRLARLLTEIYGDGDWRYTPPARRGHLPHLQGFDPQDTLRYDQTPAWQIGIQELEKQLEDPNSTGDGKWVNLELYPPSRLPSLLKLTTTGGHTEVFYVKLTDKAFSFYTIDADGTENLVYRATTKTVLAFNTPVGAIWLIKDHTGKDFAVFRAEEKTGRVFIGSPSNKIMGPWLWMIVPTEPGQGGARSTDADSLSDASNGRITEADVAANGAKEGDSVGDLVWTLGKIADTGGDNITDLINEIGLAEGAVDDYSSYALITLESATAQSDVTMRVGSDDSIKVWLNGEVVHNNPINRGANDFQDTFKVNLVAGDNLLLVKVSKRESGWSMFVGIDADVNAIYKRPSDTDNIETTVDQPADINEDGRVNVTDLLLVVISLSENAIPHPRADVNGDGSVNIADLLLVVENLDDPVNAAAPTSGDIVTSLNPAMLAGQLNILRTQSDGSHKYQEAIAFLQSLLAVTRPAETQLLANYPNPFNPETWIPYQLAKPADVILTIYTADGKVVRTLALGHQRAGPYQSRSRAVYWDGKNEVGEQVASGIYFYTLTAGDFTATRKMLIRK